MDCERSLVLIKPIAIQTANDVLQKLFYAGFNAIQKKYFVLSSDEMMEFYSLTGEFVENLSEATESDKESTYMAVCVSKENAIAELSQMFAEDETVHVSQCSSAAHKEIQFFFPNLWTKSTNHSNINEIMEHHIHTSVFPILSKSLFDAADQCPPKGKAIDALRTAMILRNPMKPIIIEPNTSAHSVTKEYCDNENKIAKW